MSSRIGEKRRDEMTKKKKQNVKKTITNTKTRSTTNGDLILIYRDAAAAAKKNWRLFGRWVCSECTRSIAVTDDSNLTRWIWCGELYNQFLSQIVYKYHFCFEKSIKHDQIQKIEVKVNILCSRIMILGPSASLFVS